MSTMPGFLLWMASVLIVAWALCRLREEARTLKHIRELAQWRHHFQNTLEHVRKAAFKEGFAEGRKPFGRAQGERAIHGEKIACPS